MMIKVVRKRELCLLHSEKEDLSYWLSRPAEERVAAVDYLRKQYYGSTGRLQRVLGFFNAHRVEYLIVGAYALAFHGAPRFTGDLDILVRPTAENAEKIMKALADFGFGSLNLTAGDFQSENQVVQLGVPPVRIDLITSITGVSWEEADRGKSRGLYGDVPTYFLGRDQFIANKRVTGRTRDLADAEALESLENAD